MAINPPTSFGKRVRNRPHGRFQCLRAAFRRVLPQFLSQFDNTPSTSVNAETGT